MKLLFCFLAFLFCCEKCICSHFRGGFFSWSPTGNNLEIEIEFRLSWDMGHSSIACDDYIITNEIVVSRGRLSCVSGCTGNIGSMDTQCTDYSNTENWMSERGRITYSNADNLTFFEFAFTGAAWIRDVGSGSWSVKSTVDLTVRTDTGTINSSPVLEAFPVRHLQRGCQYNITLPVLDPDNDIVKCRWAVRRDECGDICNTTTNMTLNEETCTITYTPTEEREWYAVALQIEDFRPSDLTRALSSVPLQFLIKVTQADDISCGTVPHFVPPTPEERACIPVETGTSVSAIVNTTSNTERIISEIQTISPVGTFKSLLMDNSYVNITWSPSDDLRDRELVSCFIATDEYGLSSEQRCIFLFVGGKTPAIIPGSQRPLGYIAESQSQWSVEFNTDFKRPTDPAYINIYNGQHDLEERIDVSTSLNVLFNTGDSRRHLNFTTNFTMQYGETYYVLLDAGVVQGATGCEAKSLATEDQTTWSTTFFIPETTIGDACTADVFCTLNGSRCVNSKCACPTGVFEPGLGLCDTMPLFAFGANVGDRSLSTDDSICSEEVRLSRISVPIQTTLYRKLYVCLTGIISFDKVYKDPKPPKTISELGSGTLIAPFYAGTFIGVNSQVWYRWADISNPSALNTSEIHLAEHVIARIYNLKTFSAKFALIATWFEVQQYSRKEQVNETSTFQTVLLTNGADTFVLYIYGQSKMNWKHVSSEDPRIWIGYKDKNNFVKSNINSFQRQALDMDMIAESKGIQGVLSYRLNTVGVPQSLDGISCLDWFNSVNGRQQKIKNAIRVMPECPCSIGRLRIDPFYSVPELSPYPSTVCATIQATSRFRPQGKTCCYDTVSGLWIQDPPRAGGFLFYHPAYDSGNHVLFDKKSKEHCCNNHSSNCDLYYEMHPVGDCYRESWFRFGTGWGDPHFRTLDGKNFIFNGHGEYILITMETTEVNFTLQARTQRAVRVDQTLSLATIFSAFAARDQSGAHIHVELNNAKTGINLFGNGIDLTRKYYEANATGVPFQYHSGGPDEANLTITKREDTLIAHFPSSDVSLNISMGIQMLTIQVLVHKKFQGLTKGLHGNFDGVSENDFILPNGTMLPGNISERQIFKYGSEWSVDGESSVFVYPAEKTFEDFKNSSFVPQFLEEVDNDTVEAAVNECGGREFLPCIFDFIFTNDEEVAQDTKQTNDTTVKTEDYVDNQIPSLSGCEILTVQPGQEVTCQFTFEDDSTDLDIVFLSNTGNAKHQVVNATDGVISYQPVGLDPDEISFTVTDQQGQSSTPINVQIVMCTLCSGHGNCSQDEYREGSETENFKYQKCICLPYYEGDDCEFDFDGCQGNPCSDGRDCTDLTPAQHKLQNRAYTCSPCDDIGGFVEDGDKCKDINECENDNGGCQQLCENTDGSYICRCETGYRKKISDGENCEDINECSEGLNNCQQLCENTPGSFQCGCYEEFMYNVDDNLCIQVTNPCESSSVDCSNTAGCTNSSGTPSCICPIGYQLTAKKDACEDIDECKQSLCPHSCVNEDGGFRCTCLPGYRITEINTCEACVFPFWGDNCQSTCTCTGSGAIRCDPVQGCICDQAWTGERCDEDVNECAVNPNICSDPYKQCINAEGYYYCQCITGFRESDISSPNTDCQDIDECQSPDLNNCDQICLNALGGYSCQCRDGFDLLDQYHCKDIDECGSLISGCEHICENKPGFFNCYCYYGYRLNDDRKTCEQVEDICTKFQSGLVCDHICIFDDGDEKCKCKLGYILADNEQTCRDYNECAKSSTNICDHSELCNNTEGSFTCGCRTGWKLQNDERTCKECDEFHYGDNCAFRCDCGVGSERCDPINGCLCKPGWTGEKCSDDINECETTDNNCTGRFTFCNNFPGSYTCECRQGYQKVMSTCKDTDECVDPSLHNCEHDCHNTGGGFSCSCQLGFSLIGNSCEDIDECLGDHGCQYECRNTPGGFRCVCPQGFQLKLSNRRNCTATHPCSAEDAMNCLETNSICYMDDDTSKCKCFSGNCTTPPVKTKTSMQIVLDISLDSSTNLAIPSIYQEFEMDITKMLMQGFNEDIIVTGIRPGSLIVRFDVLTDNSSESLGNLFSKIEGVVMGTIPLFFRGKKVDVQEMQVGKVTFDSRGGQCKIFRHLRGPCDSGFECRVQDSKAVCSAIPEKGWPWYRTVIPSCVSGICIIMIVVLCVLLVRDYKRRNHRTRNERRHPTLQRHQPFSGHFEVLANDFSYHPY